MCGHRLLEARLEPVGGWLDLHRSVWTIAAWKWIDGRWALVGSYEASVSGVNGAEYLPRPCGCAAPRTIRRMIVRKPAPDFPTITPLRRRACFAVPVAMALWPGPTGLTGGSCAFF